MKKRALSMAMLILMLFFASCKKEPPVSDDADKPESWYKNQLKSIGHFNEHISIDQATTVSGINFTTFKEAYEVIHSLTIKTPAINSSPLYREQSPKKLIAADPFQTSVYGTIVDYGSDNSRTYQYEARCTLSMPITSSLNPGSVTVLFHLVYVIVYVPGEYFGTIQSQYIQLPIQVGYTGPGTLQNPPGGPTVYVTPDGHEANTGQIHGFIQVTGTVSGNPYSWTATITGRYDFTVPEYNGDRVSIVHYSGSASGGIQ